MYKLLMRAFPGWYKYNSIYAMFPFSLPEKTREVQENLGWLSLYSFDKPTPPAKPMDFIRTYDACVRVLDDQQHFQMSWGPAIKELTGTEYMLSGDGEKYAAMHTRLHNETMGIKGAEKVIWDFYINITNELIKNSSFRIGNYFEMDAVRKFYSLALSYWLTGHQCWEHCSCQFLCEIVQLPAQECTDSPRSPHGGRIV